MKRDGGQGGIGVWHCSHNLRPRPRLCPRLPLSLSKSDRSGSQSLPQGQFGEWACVEIFCEHDADHDQAGPSWGPPLASHSQAAEPGRARQLATAIVWRRWRL